MMNNTNLTVGGFTQPAIARNLIEIPSNSEKGLSHCFIWLFPNPLYQEFSQLGKANQTFIQRLGEACVIHCRILLYRFPCSYCVIVCIHIAI